MMQVTTLAELEALYGQPARPSLVKVAPRITPEYRAWIEAAPFCALATAGPDGLDVSPRGDRDHVASVLDPDTIAIPDRRGNNRLDSLRNVLADPRCALLFLIPGQGATIRVNGLARISTDPDLLARFETEGQTPRSLLLVTVSAVYFQCARAVMRAGLWEPPVTAPELPSLGEILATLSEGAEGGPAYDAGLRDRAGRTLW